MRMAILGFWPKRSHGDSAINGFPLCFTVDRHGQKVDYRVRTLGAMSVRSIF